MNNREKTLAAINQYADKDVMDELEYYMDIDHEDESYDMADAINDAYDSAEYNNDRKLISKYREILISVGAYVAEPEKSETGRDTRFTHKGTKYNWPHAGGWETWINA